MGKPKLTTEIFIERSKEVHGDLYDYSNSIYGDSGSDKIEVICKIHGSYLVNPGNHMKGAICFQCAIENRKNTHITSFENFVNKANKIHNNEFIYDKETYQGVRKPVKIFCTKHNDFFFQVGSSHLKGHKCSFCSWSEGKGREPNTTEYFIERANDIHNFLYDYSLTNYVDLLTPVEIICKEHGSFWQKPREHLNSHGCQSCGERLRLSYDNVAVGWNKSSWVKYCNDNNRLFTIVYITKLFNGDEEFIKVGITGKTTKERFISVPYTYEILSEIKGKPEYTFDLEKKIHKVFKQYQHFPQISFAGETECFSTEILKDSNFQMFLQK